MGRPLRVSWDWVGKRALCHDGGGRNGEKPMILEPLEVGENKPGA